MTARDWDADLIVVGNDSRGRLAHFLLGSTADAACQGCARSMVKEAPHEIASTDASPSVSVVRVASRASPPTSPPASPSSAS